MEASLKNVNLDQYSQMNAVMTIDSLTFNVTIKSARLRFGHLDFLVSPQSGGGEKWVEQHKVDLVSQ